MTGEQISVLVIVGITLIPLVMITIILLKGKGEFLIAGYNTMSKEKKGKINTKLLCKFIGLMMIFLIIYVIALSVGAILKSTPIMIVSGSLFVITVVFTLIFANTKRFKN